MNADAIRELLVAIEQGKTTAEEGLQRLKNFPYEDLEFAKIDHQRSLRTGLPEVIYGAGKTAEQVARIFQQMALQPVNVLATRVTKEAAVAVAAVVPGATYHPIARTIVLRQREIPPLPGPLAVLCAGTSDLPVAEEAAITAELMGNVVNRIYDVGVAGLHRLLAHRAELLQARAIIACAGMEGALPTVVAGLVQVPVIAVPTSIGYGAAFGGIAALLGMLNSCAPNVAVVNIDNGFGAACFASTLLRTSQNPKT
jgi:NCAIR mutase (PurE)-related protein